MATSLKLAGLTSASATLATVNITVNDDGSISFVTATDEKVTIQPSADLNKLLKMALVGAGGFDSTKAWFGA